MNFVASIKCLVSALLLLAGAAGCSAPGRLEDVKDCGSFSLGLGYGVSAEVEIGALAHPTFGSPCRTYRVGHDSRRVTGLWEEEEAVIPFSWCTTLVTCVPHQPLYGLNTSLARYQRLRECSTPSNDAEAKDKWTLEYRKRGARERRTYDFLILGFPERDEFLAPLGNVKEITDLEVGLTLGCVSCRAGINPLEIVDLLLGLAGADIAGDDPDREPEAR